MRRAETGISDNPHDLLEHLPDEEHLHKMIKNPDENSPLYEDEDQFYLNQDIKKQKQLKSSLEFKKKRESATNNDPMNVGLLE